MAATCTEYWSGQLTCCHSIGAGAHVHAMSDASAVSANCQYMQLQLQGYIFLSGNFFSLLFRLCLRFRACVQASSEQTEQ